MKQLKSIILFSILAVFASCATNNDVVSNGLFQKRKYRKGFYFDKKAEKGHGTSTNDTKIIEENIDEVAVVEETSAQNEETNTTPETSSETQMDKIETPQLNSEEKEIIEESNTSGEEKVASKSEVNQWNIPVLKDVRKTSKDNVIVKSITPNSSSSAAESGAMLVLLIILALFLPPVAIAIYQGITTIFWLDLVLFLIAVGGFWFFTLSGLAGLAAVIIAFLVIFDVL